MRKQILILITLPLILSSCWKKDETKTFIRPIKIAKVEMLTSFNKDFVGVVSAVSYADLAFQVGGVLKKVYIDDGSKVRKGDLIAELDPQDFILKNIADKAQYQVNKNILERDKRLIDKAAISQQEYEIAFSNYEQSKSAFEYSTNQLSYTKLRAPYDGSIEKKYVETYQKVNQGEKIAKILSPNKLEVDFTIPESDMRINSVDYAFYVEFGNIKGKAFKTSVKEIVDASVNGMGIPVTLSITDPDFKPELYNIKAGFSCRVKVVINESEEKKGLIKIPITAIFSENTNPTDKFVWIYDSKTGTVIKRKIETRELAGDQWAIIKSGLEIGEDIVTAGVYQLFNNQKVNLIK
ncbi:MAG: efflux RND transporter periplasmic adaptor subunit [Rikenellaceae bacterium]